MGPDDVEPEWEAPLVGRNDVGEGGKDPFGQYSWATWMVSVSECCW